MSSKSGVVKLCDFGFARTLGEYCSVTVTFTFHMSHYTCTYTVHLCVILLYILTSFN